MSQAMESYAVWLADFYLLTAVLLTLALAALAVLRQPAKRLAIVKSTLIAVILLGAFCSIPGWSVVPLLRPTQLSPVAQSHAEVRTAAAVVPNDAAQSMNTSVPLTPAAPVLTSEPIGGRASEENSQRISWPIVFGAVHLAGGFFASAWLVLGWFAARRLRCSARPAPPSLVAMMNEWRHGEAAPSVEPVLLISDRIDVPVALGAPRAVTLLPLRWVNDSPPAAETSGNPSAPSDLRAVLAHELAHVANHDLHWVAVARALVIALWANPLFWVLRRRLRLDQEALADAAAAEVTSRQTYAEQLVAWAREVSGRPSLHLSSAVGLWEGPSQLRQ